MAEVEVLPGRAVRRRAVLDGLTIDEHLDGPDVAGEVAGVGVGLGQAIGSETWGSILSPAGFCGVTGLRPSYGRVSRHGAMALCWTLDKLGPLALTADDGGLVLDAIAGPIRPTRPPPIVRSATSRAQHRVDSRSV